MLRFVADSWCSSTRCCGLQFKIHLPLTPLLLPLSSPNNATQTTLLLFICGLWVMSSNHDAQKLRRKNQSSSRTRSADVPVVNRPLSRLHQVSSQTPCSHTQNTRRFCQFLKMNTFQHFFLCLILQFLKNRLYIYFIVNTAHSGMSISWITISFFSWVRFLIF